MKLLIFGPPGSGKGTQAKLFAQKLELKHISSDILRKEVKIGSLLGRKIKKYMDKGELVPNDVMFLLIKKELPKDNFILDGFPRDIAQSKWLDIICRIDYVIVLDTPFHLIKSRLLKRSNIEGREDDNEVTIRKRYKIYREKTEPLLKHYKDKIILIDGSLPVEEVQKEVIKILKK